MSADHINLTEIPDEIVERVQQEIFDYMKDGTGKQTYPNSRKTVNNAVLCGLGVLDDWLRGQLLTASNLIATATGLITPTAIQREFLDGATKWQGHYIGQRAKAKVKHGRSLGD